MTRSIPGGIAGPVRPKDVAVFVAFVAVYVLMGRAGLALAYYQQNATLLWAPSGLAVAAVWFRGARAVPAVWLGALLTNLLIGSSWPLAAWIGLGNAAEAYLAYLAISRTGLTGGIHRVGDVARFFVYVVMGATAVAAVNGAVALRVLADLAADRVLPTGLIWWLGDAGGVLVVAPLVLAFRRPPVLPAGRRVAGVALVALVVALSASLAFAHFLPGSWTHLPVAFLPFPALAWASVRFGMRGATVGTTAVTFAGVVGMLLRTGPFDYGSVHVDLAMLWFFMASMAASSMLIATAVEERVHEAKARRDGEQWLALALEGGSAEAFELAMGAVPTPRVGVHPEDRPAVDAAMAACATGGHDGWECEYRSTDGERWIRERARVVLRDDDGTPLRAVGLRSDVTARREDDERQRALERDLQESKRLGEVGMLAGGVAHDFNNLLTVIRGNAALARGTRDRAEVDESLDAIDEATARAADLTEQLLAYAGKRPLQRRDVDLGQLSVETVRLLGSTVPERVAVSCDVAPGTPLVEGDPSQLRQVLMNLVWNAVEAIGAGRGTISVTVLHAAGHVLLRVEDDGAGMDEATRTRIFEPFFSTKVRGRGLGMAAVLGIVRSHGGHVTVESAPGAGSTFEVRFPATDRLPRAEPAPSEPRAPRARAERTERARVLVVDDERAIRSTTVMLLEELGYAAAEAADGREALLRVEADGPIDVALLDMTMPGETGLQVLDALRAKAPGLPGVLMSGYSEDLLRASPPEGVPFLKKPFRPSELAERLQEALGTARRVSPVP